MQIAHDTLAFLHLTKGEISKSSSPGSLEWHVILQDICLSMISKEAYVSTCLSHQISSHLNVLTGSCFGGGGNGGYAPWVRHDCSARECAGAFDILSFKYMFFTIFPSYCTFSLDRAVNTWTDTFALAFFSKSFHQLREPQEMFSSDPWQLTG